MGKPEAYVEKYIVKLAKEHDCLYYKFTSPSNNGVPDRIIIGHGKVVFIEAKAPGETTRPLQKKVIKNMIARGATVYTMDTREQVDTFFAWLCSAVP